MTLLNKGDKIFIAGGSGMVGSAIIRKLHNLGFKNLVSPSSLELDLKNSDLVFQWFKENKPDIVICAAAKVGGIYANDTYPVDFLLENLKIQNNVIEGAKEDGVCLKTVCGLLMELSLNLLLLIKKNGFYYLDYQRQFLLSRERGYRKMVK